MLTRKDFISLAANNAMLLGRHRDTASPTAGEEAALRAQIEVIRCTAEALAGTHPRMNLRLYLEQSGYFTAANALDEWRVILGMPKVYWRLLADGIHLMP